VSTWSADEANAAAGQPPPQRGQAPRLNKQPTLAPIDAKARAIQNNSPRGMIPRGLFRVCMVHSNHLYRLSAGQSGGYNGRTAGRKIPDQDTHHDLPRLTRSYSASPAFSATMRHRGHPGIGLSMP
jgi:hypothetical protein